MSRGKVGSRPVLDATFLSASAIGSPAAFSTAIKPPGSFNTHHSDGDASLLAHQPHEISRLGENVPGPLSLSFSSEPPPRTEGPVADETSFGILDLDNMHESSMSVFLTSPRTSHDLAGSNAPLGSTSRPLVSASQLPASPPASMGPLRLSGTTGPTGGSRLVEQVGEGGREGEEMGLPDDLLETSSSVGYSSDGEGEGEGEVPPPEGDQMDIDSAARHSGVVLSGPTGSIPDQVRRTGDGHENRLSRPLQQGFPHQPHTSSLSSLSSGQQPSLQDRRGGFSVAEILQEAQREGEDLKTSHLFLTSANSLITDQEEPSIMTLAAEFSRFQPDQLTSTVESESLLQRSHPLAGSVDKSRRAHPPPPPVVSQSSATAAAGNTTVTLSTAAVVVRGGGVGGGREEKMADKPDNLDVSSPTAGNTSPEGLPSAYLHQSSVHSSASQTPSHTASHTPSGTPDSSPPLSPPPPPPAAANSQSPLTSRLAGDGGRMAQQRESVQRGGEKGSNSPYNPFDSEDVVGDDQMGDEEFGGGLDSDSFMAQLKADEVAVEEANKLLLPAGFVASTPQTPSFSLSSSTALPPSHPPPSLPPTLPPSAERELSIGEYFGQRSYKLGVLQASGLVSSSERPQFSSLSALPTPPSDSREPPTSQLPPERNPHTSPPAPEANLQASPGVPKEENPEAVADTTLVAGEDGRLGDEESPNSHPASPPLPQSLKTHLADSGGVSSGLATTRSLSSHTTSSTSSKSSPTAAGQVDTLTTSLSTTAASTAVSGSPTTAAVLGPTTTSSVAGGEAKAEAVTVAAHLVSRADSLTPVVTVHTPFPMQYQIPRLDLSGVSNPTPAAHLSSTATAGLKLFPPSTTSNLLSTSPSLAKSLPSPVPTVASISSSQDLTLTATTAATMSIHTTPGVEPGLKHSGMDSGLSTGMEHRLASQYWRPSSGASTLMFPELSSTSLSPPPTDIAGLTSMPTPSLAHLSGGFNTTSSDDANFLESLLGSFPASSSLGNLSASQLSSKLPPLSQYSLPSISKSVASSTSFMSVSHTPGITTSQSTGTEPGSTKKKSRNRHSPPTSVPSRSSKTPPDAAGGGKKKKSVSQSPPASSSTSKLNQSSPGEVQLKTSSSPTSTTAAGASSGAGSPGEGGSPGRQCPLSPKTNTARKKISQLKAALDMTEFDAAAFLSRLEGDRGSLTSQAPSSLTSTASASLPFFPESATAQLRTSLQRDLPTTAVVSQTPTKIDHRGLRDVTTTTATTVNQSTTAVTTVNQSTTAATTVNQSTTAATTVNQSTTAATTVSQSTTAATTVSQSTTAATTVNQSTTAATTVNQSTTAATMVNQSTTAATTVNQSTTAAATVNQSTTAATIVSTRTQTTSALPTTTATVQKLSPSPTKPSVSSVVSVNVSGQSSTANMSPSSNASSSGGGLTDGGSPEKYDTMRVEGKTPRRGERKRPRQPENVVVRDIGVGTTPGLERAQPRSSSLIQTGRRLDTTQPNSPPKTAHAPVSPSTSPRRKVHTSPLSPPSSSVAPSHRTEPSLSSQPIYTSPRLLTHTSLSPPPQPPPQPLTGRERRNTPEPNSLRVPDSLCFKSPCCVGVTLPNHLQISNVGDRWLQLTFELSELYCNGAAETDLSSFFFPQRCFVSPRKTEPIKIGFSPRRAGSYEAVLVCRARLVVSSERDISNFIQESIVVKALAVPPLLEVATPSTAGEETCLDYGLLTAGTSLSLPLHLTNLGSSELPLRLSIAAPTLSQLYFSFDDPPPSLKTPSSSPSTYLHSRPFSTTFTLPPKPSGSGQKPEVYPLNVNFKSPKNFAEESTPLGSPEEIKAQVNVSVEGPNATGILCSVPVRVTVGVARLHVPRSLQALSLSCCEGQTMTREVPFKNAGNIPLQIALEFPSDDRDHFQVTPHFLELSPAEEAQIRVSFSPHSSPLVIDGCLMVHVQPHGPSYELKVQGNSLERETTDGAWENLLFCNKPYLYWGGLEVGTTTEQKLLLQNSFSSTVPLQFSVRHQDQVFQLQKTESDSAVEEHSQDLPEQTQLQLNLLFSPPSTAIFRNALDIFDTLHSKKFRIPLCGYGGTSGVEVISARHSTSGGLWVDLGPITMYQESSVKISIYNSGSRAGFAKMLVFPMDDEGDNLSPLPLSRASVTPSGCVLQPQQMKELCVTYRPSSSEEVDKCVEATAPLARLVVVHGDEIIRQRFQRVCCSAEGEEGEEGEVGGEERGRYQLKNEFNRNFLEDFLGQETAESELDFGQFEVENEERFFEQQIQQIQVALSGSPATRPPPSTRPPSHPLSTSFDTPPRQTKQVSPSKSLPGTTPPHEPTTSSLSVSSQIISSLTLVFPDTISGQRSEKLLDVRNPFSQPLQWKLSSIASPFVRDATSTSSSISKANYSVFWVHERRGTVAPHTTAQVLVMFQPHDVGSFSQIWDLQVSCQEVEGGSKKIRLSFGGKAVGRRSKAEQEQLAPRVRFSSPPHRNKPPSPTLTTGTTSHPPTLTTGTTSHAHPPTLTTGTTLHPPTLTTNKRLVYIKEETIQFPSTEVRGHSMVKVKVCNRDKCQHQFQVVSLSPPFSVDHQSFLLGSRQCARLPVHFSPTRPGVFEAVLAVRTSAGHQAFSQLTGLATALNDSH